MRPQVNPPRILVGISVSVVGAAVVALALLAFTHHQVVGGVVLLTLGGAGIAAGLWLEQRRHGVETTQAPPLLDLEDVDDFTDERGRYRGGGSLLKARRSRGVGFKGTHYEQR